MRSYITVTSGMAGYFAVQIWWNNEDPKMAFWEPYDTGLGRYREIEMAIEEAKEWAEAEGLRYVAPGESYERSV